MESARPVCQTGKMICCFVDVKISDRDTYGIWCWWLYDRGAHGIWCLWRYDRDMYGIGVGGHIIETRTGMMLMAI